MRRTNNDYGDGYGDGDSGLGNGGGGELRFVDDVNHRGYYLPPRNYGNGCGDGDIIEEMGRDKL